MRVTCLIKRWQHHTISGGYDQLAGAVGAKVIRRHEFHRVILREMSKKTWNRWSNTGAYLEHYQFEDWVAEQQLVLRSLVNPPDVVHILYGDEQLDFLLRWRSLLRCPLVVSFHRPAERIAKRFECFQRNEIKGIDAVIVLARSEISTFQRWFGMDKVVYVPHGIDTSRFLPGDHEPTTHKLKLIFVGHHMRDWDVLHRVIDEINSCNLDIHFDAVIPVEYAPYLTGCSNVSVHSKICETKLIELYRSADALILPVTAATANNAVLEALACGLPVITTDVGGMPDYVSNQAGWLLPKGGVEPMVELVKQLFADRAIARARREAARAQALKFDWLPVGRRLLAIYSAVRDGRSPSASQ
jgi:glycosyltransferase involved in cell wall biosynthesis